MTPASTPLAGTRAARSSKNLLLRALLGVSGELDAETVLRMIGNLPGVSAAICLHEGRNVAAAHTDTTEGQKFAQNAPRLLAQLQNVIPLFSASTTESFTLKSDSSLATFSLQGPTTLCVLHSPQHDDSALEEKVTLIGRELAVMLRDSALAA